MTTPVGPKFDLSAEIALALIFVSTFVFDVKSL